MLDIVSLKLVLLTVLFLVSFVFVLLPYRILSFAQSHQNTIQRRVYETTFSFLNCFAAGVFLATCFLDLLPEVRTVMHEALKFYIVNKSVDISSEKSNNEFPFSEFVVIMGVFLILTIEQMALVFKEKYLKESRIQANFQNSKSQLANKETNAISSPKYSEIKPLLDKNDNGLKDAPGYGSLNIYDIKESLDKMAVHPSTSLLHKICGSIDETTPSFYDKDQFLKSPIEIPPENSHSHHFEPQDLQFYYDIEAKTITDTRKRPHVGFSPQKTDSVHHQDLQHNPNFISKNINNNSNHHHDNVNYDNPIPIVITAPTNRSTGATTSSYHHHHHHPVHHLSADAECGHPPFRLYILVLSLAIHSLFEGMAVALQPTAQTILGLFGALCFHKITVAFSLGLNLVQSSSLKLWPHIITCALIFASMSPIGIALSFILDSAGGTGYKPIITPTSLQPSNSTPSYSNANQSTPNVYSNILELSKNAKSVIINPLLLPPSLEGIESRLSQFGGPLLNNVNFVDPTLNTDESTSGLQSPKPWVLLTSAILQGIACGTFLYVTFFELLPHEMNSGRNRLPKVIFLILGFGFVTAFILYDTYFSVTPPT